MSWGIKITVVYVGFVILISSMVAISASHKVELVAKDYYAQELDYQQRIDAIANEKTLKATITHEMTDNEIILDFSTTEMLADFEGEVLFYRPSDSSKDVKMKLGFDKNGKQVINRQLLNKGIYKMCITWKNAKKTFYKEEIITN